MASLALKTGASALVLAVLWSGASAHAQTYSPAVNDEVVFEDEPYLFLGRAGCPQGRVRIRPADEPRATGQCVLPSELSPPVPPPPPPIMEAPPPVVFAPAPTPAPVTEAPVSSAPLIGTEFALPPSNLGPIPTLTVVLTERSPARNRALCTAFNAEQSYSEVVGQSRVARNVIPVRWLLTRDPGEYEDCDANVRNYDFARGQALLAEAQAALRAGGTPGDFSGQGPFFVEQIAGETGITYVVVDLSATDGAEFGGLGARLGEALAAQSRALNRAPGASAPELRASGPTPPLTPGGPTLSGGSTAEQAADLAGGLAGNIQAVQRGCRVFRDPNVQTAAGLLGLFLGPLRAVVSIADRFCTAGAGARSGG